MDEFFAWMPTTNDGSLCIGPLTRAESQDATEAGIGDGSGYYIYVAPAPGSNNSVEILGRLSGAEEARRLSELMGLQSGNQDQPFLLRQRRNRAA